MSERLLMEAKIMASIAMAEEYCYDGGTAEIWVRSEAEDYEGIVPMTCELMVEALTVAARLERLIDGR